jgi:hypothetical protein
VTEILEIRVAAQPKRRQDIRGFLQLGKLIFGRIFLPIFCHCSLWVVESVPKEDLKRLRQHL